MDNQCKAGGKHAISVIPVTRLPSESFVKKDKECYSSKSSHSSTSCTIITVHKSVQQQDTSVVFQITELKTMQARFFSAVCVKCGVCPGIEDFTSLHQDILLMLKK